MDVKGIRSDFPILDDQIYMDSAATSLTPEPVLAAVADYYRHYRANVGRGVYRTAQVADGMYREAHRKVAGFIGAGGAGASGGMTVFTRNATESINAVARGIRWHKGDRIVSTLIEHHSNMLPWMRLAEYGVQLVLIKPDADGTIGPEEFEEAIDGKTRLVAVTAVSNALGSVMPVREISRICEEKGAMLLVDGAQSVPHAPTDVSDIGCDFLCFSGHKMLAPTGTGVLWTKMEIEPLTVGGGMVDDVTPLGWVPKKGYEGLEAGTPDISGGIGLGRAVDYLQGIGMGEVEKHSERLTRRLLDGLSDIEKIDVYGPPDGPRGALVSFNVRGMDPHDVALVLDEASSISVRSGHHCCIPLMRHLGLPHGTVRASIYIYNTEEEVDLLLSTVEEIARMA